MPPIFLCIWGHHFELAKSVRCPGIEPGSQEWESCMIPLHQRRHLEMPGIEPGAFHMRSERSTTEPHPLTSALSYMFPAYPIPLKEHNFLFLKLTESNLELD